MAGHELTRRTLLTGAAAAAAVAVTGCARNRDDGGDAGPSSSSSASASGAPDPGSDGSSATDATPTPRPGSTAYVPPPGDEWEAVPTDDPGWSAEGLDALAAMVEATNGSTLTITVGGRLLVERYFGTTTPEQVQDVASVQKSVMSTLAGIAREEGLLDLDRTVTDVLGPGWSRAAPAEEAAITVHHVLTMTSGLDPDDLTKVTEPGTVFVYNTPVYQKLRRVLETVSGTDIDTYCRTRLLDPIGAGDTSRWRPRSAAARSGDAVGDPTWGLALTARDMARFGLVAMRNGLWGDREVVPAGWFEEAWTPSEANPDYGLLWWLLGRSARGRGAPDDWVAALGADDQKIYVVPSLDLVLTRQGRTAREAGQNTTSWDRQLMTALLAART